MIVGLKFLKGCHIEDDSHLFSVAPNADVEWMSGNNREAVLSAKYQEKLSND